VRSNALKALNAGRFPEISFTTEAIAAVEDSYRLSGTLRIRGKTRPHEVILHTKRRDGTWRMSTESVVRQSAFGVKPYSLLMGSLRVADDVTVSFSAVRATGE
jgi:polyisoprenoid-binding protein YceI